MTRLVVIVTLVLVLGWAQRQAQAQIISVISIEAELSKAINDAIASCNSRLVSGEFKSRVEAAICSNEGMTKAYQNANFPYMDLIFQYELANLQTIAKADRGEISDRDIQVEFATASLQMKAQVAQRDAAAAAEQRAAQAEAEREGRAQAATEARAGRNAIMQFLLANKPFQLPPSPPNLASSPTINCTTNYAGSAAYTNCR